MQNIIQKLRSYFNHNFSRNLRNRFCIFMQTAQLFVFSSDFLFHSPEGHPAATCIEMRRIISNRGQAHCPAPVLIRIIRLDAPMSYGQRGLLLHFTGLFVKVQTFFLHNQRPVHNSRIHGHNILTQESHKGQLNTTHKE